LPEIVTRLGTKQQAGPQPCYIWILIAPPFQAVGNQTISGTGFAPGEEVVFSLI